MGIGDFGILDKLKITSKNTGKVFEAMFNPESYTETFANQYSFLNTVNSKADKAKLNKSKPQDFKIKLIIDGTGAADHNLPGTNLLRESVLDKVKKFRNLTWSEKGKKLPLKIEWGEFKFDCLLLNVNITYNLFDRGGKPLRAELDASFIGDPGEEKKPDPLNTEKKEDAGDGSIQNGIKITVS